jgi:hypothetical protein
MLLLAFGVTILDEHTRRFACLETDTPLLATLGTADVGLVHRRKIMIQQPILVKPIPPTPPH